MQQVMVNTLITGAGSFGVGYLVGWSFRKILKFILIGLGLIAGIIFVALALLQRQGYVSEIKWDKMATDIYTSTNSTLTNIHMDTIQHTIGYLGIPLTGGLGLGLCAGFFFCHQILSSHRSNSVISIPNAD
jgi:uncharacterized membrane protein (Fun14 family)